MGTRFTIILFAEENLAQKASKEAFARIAELDAKLSDYQSESELSQLSATSGTKQWVKVSGDLLSIMKASQALSRETEGAFDVTVGPAVKLWRRSRKSGRMPSDEELQSARSRTGYQSVRVKLEEGKILLETPGMLLDLGAVAKGYALDAAMKILVQNHGITRALVEGGGDMVLGEAPPGKKGWTVAIGGAGEEQSKDWLILKNTAVATSGDVFQFVEIDGQRYAHIVDPRTGLGLVKRVQATVVAPSGVEADMLASALCVLTSEKGLELVEKRKGVEARISLLQNEKIVGVETENFSIAVDKKARTEEPPGLQK